VTAEKKAEIVFGNQGFPPQMLRVDDRGTLLVLFIWWSSDLFLTVKSGSYCCFIFAVSFIATLSQNSGQQ